VDQAFAIEGQRLAVGQVEGPAEVEVVELRHGLESALGHQLFDRTPQRLRMKPVGAVVDELGRIDREEREARVGGHLDVVLRLQMVRVSPHMSA